MGPWWIDRIKAILALLLSRYECSSLRHRLSRSWEARHRQVGVGSHALRRGAKRRTRSYYGQQVGPTRCYEWTGNCIGTRSYRHKKQKMVPIQSLRRTRNRSWRSILVARRLNQVIIHKDLLKSIKNHRLTLWLKACLFDTLSHSILIIDYY